MRLGLDTNRYSDFHRGDAAVARVLESAERIFLPFAMVAELRVGFVGGDRGTETSGRFAAF